MKLKTILIGILINLFCVSQVFAFKIGRISGINFNSAVKEVYDDNITFVKDNKKQDFRTDLTIGLSAYLEGKTRNLNIAASVTQALYTRFKKFNNTSENFSLDYLQELSRKSRFTVSNDFTHREDPQSLEDEFGRTGNRYKYYMNNFNLNYTRELNKQFTILCGYSNQLYDPSRSDLRASYLNRGSLEADFIVTSKTILIGMFEYMHRKFKSSTTIRTSRFAGGIRQYLTNRLYLDCRAGKDYTKASGGNKSNAQFYSGSLVHEVDDKTRLSVSFMKQDSSSYYATQIFKSTRISLSFVRQLFKRLSLAISGFYGEGKYTDTGRSDLYKGGNMSLTYDITDKIKANMSYNYSATNSNVEANDYIRNVGMLGMTIDF